MSKFNILVVDDNYDKFEVVGKVSKRNHSCEITPANNVKDALEQLKNRVFDLLIVDMNLPSSIGESPSLDSGVDLLTALFKNQIFNKPLSIIAVTSHRDAYELNKKKLDELGIPFIQSDIYPEIFEIVVTNQISYFQSLLSKQKLSNETKIPSSLNGVDLEKITMRWIYQHVELKHWIIFLVLMLSAFSLGVKMSSLSLVKEVYQLSSKNIDVENKQNLKIEN